MPPLPVPIFFKGDQVEVTKQVNGPDTLTYYAATVLSSPSNHKPQILIQYNCSLTSDSGDGKPLREMVDFECLRPVPRTMQHERFEMGDSVDVFYDNGWQKGTVKDLLENSMYVVGFDGKRKGIVAKQCRLRLHLEWDDGLWTRPFVENKNSSITDVKPKKLRIKITCNRRKPISEQIFETGSKVEVRTDKEGYIGAWYDATIVGIIGNDKYMIEYLNLLKDDANTFFKAVVSENIRPCPPLVLGANFERFDPVDAWYNDGWWEGVVSEVGNQSKYMVYFRSTNETMEFEGSLLRHHHEWIDGEWKRKEKSPKLENLTSNPPEKFNKGTKVEVRSDEIGFQGAWFAAIILEALEKDKYVIQYQDLLTEDSSDCLKEEANGSDIRPIPPAVQRLCPFRLCEMVEAWYNEGWWVGYINRVHANSKYTVHFKTNEDMEFEHRLLRTHQEYIDGNWVAGPMEKSPKLENLTSNPPEKFNKGTKVEVRSDEVGFEGAWFAAIILEALEKDKYVIQYQDLLTEDSSDFLKEEANGSDIRPIPPVVQRLCPFRLCEMVEAWYNDGWWVGYINRVHANSKYTVHFKTNEDMEFEHRLLRTHQEYIDGNWVTGPMEWDA